MSTTKQESAFPVVVGGDQRTLHNGVTKRELFAAMAMQGLLADPKAISEDRVATFAVKCADALIKQLSK